MSDQAEPLWFLPKCQNCGHETFDGPESMLQQTGLVMRKNVTSYTCQRCRFIHMFDFGS